MRGRSIPLASHAVRRTRTQPSAASALRGVDCSGRQVHVSAPDLHFGAVSTVLEMTSRKIDAVLLADLCGSWIHPQLLTASLDLIRMGDGLRVARAVDCVPRDPSFLPAGDRYALEARLLSGEGNYRALKRALEIVSGSGETMLAGARGLYRPPRGRAVAERRRRRPVAGIDPLTSDFIYRIADLTPLGQPAWTLGLLVAELRRRGIISRSIRPAQVRRHFEIKERRFGVANPRWIRLGQRRELLLFDALDQAAAGRDIVHHVLAEGADP